MRKKDLFNQNVSLFEQLQSARIEIKRLNSLICSLTDKIEALESAKENNESLDKEKETVFRVDSAEDSDNEISFSVIDNIKLDEITQYGAEIIGKIVVSASQYSNSLTVGGNTKYRELVNLLLGRTEVAKADILAAVTSENTPDEIKNSINDIYDTTLEYFSSVMAQMT